MHRYEELEKLYYKKKFRKYFLIATFVFAGAGVLVYYYSSVSDKKAQEKIEEINQKLKVKFNAAQKGNDKNISVKKVAVVKKTEKKPVIRQKPVEEKKKSESLTPNLSFVIPKIKEDEPKKTAHVTKKTEEIKKEPKNTISVIKEQSVNVKDLISSFKKEPKYDTAMVISKYYYNKKDYKNAKLWALKANSIDPSKYQSWKMFAMILIKKNDKIKAKEVLKIYLNDYGDNEEIYKLLRSIDE